MLPRIKSTADFVSRLAFFAVAPLVIVFASALFPVTGALVMIGLALLVFFFGEAMTPLIDRVPFIRKVLRVQFAFEAYYREHPPRPFLYYVFYPLLFPYWLWNRKARQEFLLFKGYTLVSIVILLASSAWQYTHVWRPELSLRQFAGVFAMQIVVETLLVLMLVMPIVTSVVHFHTRRSPAPLAALLAVGLASSVVAIVRLERRRDPVVSFATRERVGMRTAHDPKRAKEVELMALNAAWKELPPGKTDVGKDGKVEGAALEAARKALTAYYRNDEAYAFDLWLSKTPKHEILVVYFEARRGRAPIYQAMDRAGRVLASKRGLPKRALQAMKQAADGVIDDPDDFWDP